jgi:hypothetical protein
MENLAQTVTYGRVGRHRLCPPSCDGLVGLGLADRVECELVHFEQIRGIRAAINR